MGEKREGEWKATTREKEGNVKEYWGNHDNGVIGMGYEEDEKSEEEEKEMRKKEKLEKGYKNSGIGRVTDDKLKWSQANEWGKLNWNN